MYNIIKAQSGMLVSVNPIKNLNNLIICFDVYHLHAICNFHAILTYYFYVVLFVIPPSFLIEEGDF